MASAPPAAARSPFGLGVVLRVAAIFVSTGIALRLTPFVVHGIGDRSYGLWTLVTTVGSYYGLLDLGLSGAVTRHVAAALGARNQGQVNQVASSALVMYGVVGGVVFLCSLACAAVAGFFFHTPADAAVFSRLVLIFGASTALTVPVRVFFGLLNAHLRFDLSATLEIGSPVLRAILIYVLLTRGGTVTSLAWANLAAAVVSLTAAALLCRSLSSGLSLRWKHFSRATAKGLVHYGSISLVAQVADLLRFQLDAIVVAAYLGVAAVTHYNVAGSLAQYFITFMLAVTGVLGPVFSRAQAAGNPDAIRRTLAFGTKVSVALATFICFSLVAWGKPFIVCWMGPDYLDAYPALVALSVGLMFALWQTPSMQLLYGVSRHGSVAVFNSAEGVANLILSLLLVHRYGLFGVALGTMIPMIATKVFIQPWYACKAADIGVAEYFRMLLKAISLTLLALVVPALLALWLTTDSLIRIGLLIAASFCCFVPVLYFALFNSEERNSVASAIPMHWLRFRKRNPAALSPSA